MASTDPLVITGFSFRMPQDAVDETSFWTALENLKNLSSDWPSDRVCVDGFYDGGSKKPNTLHARGAHFTKEDPAVFDAPFFGITSKEAAAMDPKQRWSLEAAFHTFENAGIPMDTLRGSRTAVIATSFTDDYSAMQMKDPDTAPRQIATGTQPSILPNRISWYFDLRGPSVHIDTACSSSMVALDLACKIIRSGDATAALVLGCNTLLSPDLALFLSNMNFLSSSSRCQSFDSKADGYARGEGVVAMMIRPLSTAIQHGDMIRAVIRMTATNQDGRTPGITHPSVEGQEALIRHAYARAGLGLEETRYVEAHGTGTAVGDPIEVNAIGRVFGKHRSADDPLYAGSVKANIGHLEGASGLAGVLKSVLMLEKGIILPNALMDTLNPNIAAAKYNIRVPTQCLPWPTLGIRRVSVNSFGFGGTNSHVILDDAYNFLRLHDLVGHHCTLEVPPTLSNGFHSHADGPLKGTYAAIPNGISNGLHYKTNGTMNESENVSKINMLNGVYNSGDHAVHHHEHAGVCGPRPRLLVWSAADAGALARMLEAHEQYYHTQIAGNGLKIYQFAYTLAARRSRLHWRSFSVISEQHNITQESAPRGDGLDPKFLSATKPVRMSNENIKLAFVFSGQGAQHRNMGIGLCIYPVFRDSMARSDEILSELGCQWSIFDKISGTQVDLPEYSQPLCIAVQIALVDLLESFGTYPAAVVGHSSGEIAAAYAIGALSQESACRVAYYRGLLAGKHRRAHPSEAMMAVNLAQADIPRYLEQVGILHKNTIHAACVNSSTNVTLSGDGDDMEVLKRFLDDQGIFARIINTGVAYHSPAMQSLAGEYSAHLVGNLYPSTKTPNGDPPLLVSSVTGKILDSRLMTTADYWVDNLVSPVLFYQALQKLVGIAQPRQDGYTPLTDFIEIGPHAGLRRPVMDTVASSAIRFHAALERHKPPAPTLLTLIGRLFCLGSPVSICAANGIDEVNRGIGDDNEQPLHNPPRFLVDLPPYQFDHSRRYWAESRLSKDFRFRPHTAGHLLGRRAHDFNALRPRWRNWLSREVTPWLGDHIVTGDSLCPGSGILVMAIEAVKQVATAQSDRKIAGYFIKDGQFLAPIRVGDTVENAVETEVHLRSLQKSFEKDMSTFQICIFTYHENRWTECFHGDIEVQFGGTEASDSISSGLEEETQQEHARVRRHIEESVASCSKAVSSKTFYKYCADRGLQFGAAFQNLQDIHWDGKNNSVARIDLTTPTDTERQQIGDSPVHPAILDAVVHLIFTQFTDGSDPASQPPTLVPQRLPKGWISARVWDESARSVRLSSTMANRSERATTVNGSFHVMAEGDSNEVLCVLEDMALVQVSASRKNEIDHAPQPSSDCFLYGIAWKPQLSALLSAQALQEFCDESSRVTIDGSSNGAYHEKLEEALLTVAHTVLRDLPISIISHAPRHLRQYAAAIEGLYRKHGQLTRCEVDNSRIDGDIAASALQVVDKCCEELPEIRILSLVSHALPSIFRGETDPLALLFDSEAAKDFYGRVFAEPVKDGRLKVFLDLKSHEVPDMKILEVGAGTGAFTKEVIDILNDLERDSDSPRFSKYTYTDISPAYFDGVQDTFKQYPSQLDRMEFDTFDLERDPCSGEAPAWARQSTGEYDLIIACSVVHATTSIRKTLQNMRKFLKPGGQLILLEITDPDSASINIAFGALEGWWLSTEEWRQQGPMVDESRWSQNLEQSGFSGLDLLLRDRYGDRHLTSIIVSTAVDAIPCAELISATIPPAIKILLDPTSSFQAMVAAEVQTHYPEAQVLHLADFCDSGRNRNPGLVSDSDVVVSILDLGGAALATMSEPDFLSLQNMVQMAQNILWVGSGPLDSDFCISRGPQGATAQGFLRCIRSEETTKHIVALAIESCDSQGDVKFLLEVLHTCFFYKQGRDRHVPLSDETEFIVRDNQLTVGRLVRETKLDDTRAAYATPRLRNEKYQPDTPIMLETGAPGMLDSLRFTKDAAALDDLGTDEVEILATAWALNFRDMFVALGRMGDEPMGFDCAGVVTRVGMPSAQGPSATASSFRPGDRVVMVQAGCMRSHPRAAPINVMKIPDNVALEDAVSVLTPGITAYHSLKNVARLERGERVLIHAAAGSTGQMAVSIAQMLGAEIFATVGSDDKKNLLMRQFGVPEDHIFYSRDSSFKQGIHRMTDGQGVEVVLNSLSGKSLTASWECLAPYGRFIEIGKVDIGANSSLPMGGFSQNKSFAQVDLYHIFLTKPSLSRELLESIVELTAQGLISRPRPLHIYSVAHVEQAFRFMQSGKNTGRIVIKLDHEDIVPKFMTEKKKWQFDSNATYVVAGGLGGCGRAILRWMATKGASNIIVPSRSGISSHAAQDLIAELSAKGVRIVAPRCDASSLPDLSRMLRDCADNMPPVKGCINSAMALQDALFENMTHSQWSTTIRSKVDTSWNLHLLLPNLDFFIMLSSMLGIYGSISQCNYVAGCAFQDALARYRNANGLSASIALDLGWMRTIGIVAENDEYRKYRQNVADIAPVEEADLLALLDHYCQPGRGVLGTEKSQVLVGALVPADFYALGEQPPFLVQPLFRGFCEVQEGDSAAKGNSINDGKEREAAAQFRASASAEERATIVVGAIRVRLARALGVDSEEIDPRRELAEYGVDSLMAVELRNWIRNDFDAQISVFEIMSTKSISGVGGLVVKRVEEK